MSWEWCPRRQGHELRPDARSFTASPSPPQSLLTAFGLCGARPRRARHRRDHRACARVRRSARSSRPPAFFMPACRPWRLLWLRGSEPMGFLSVLFIFLIVAATDTAAFAAGRLIGGPSLAARDLAQQDLERPRRRPSRRGASRPSCSRCSSALHPAALAVHWALAMGLDRAGRRPGRVGAQAHVRRQGCEQPDSRPRRLHGSRRRYRHGCGRRRSCSPLLLIRTCRPGAAGGLYRFRTAIFLQECQLDGSMSEFVWRPIEMLRAGNREPDAPRHRRPDVASRRRQGPNASHYRAGRHRINRREHARSRWPRSPRRL